MASPKPCGVSATPPSISRAGRKLVEAQKSEEEFVEYILSSLPKFPEEYVEIKRVNAGLVTPSEGKASELELGKNICALAQVYDQANA